MCIIHNSLEKLHVDYSAGLDSEWTVLSCYITLCPIYKYDSDGAVLPKIAMPQKLYLCNLKCILNQIMIM